MQVSPTHPLNGLGGFCLVLVVVSSDLRLVDIENSLLGVPSLHRAFLLEIRKIYVRI